MSQAEGGSRVASFIRRHRVLLAAAGLIALGGLVFIVTFFQPQKLFIDERVDEKAARGPASASGAGETSPLAPSPDQGQASQSQANTPDARLTAPVELVRGRFRSLEHETTGTAIITELPDGSRVLRLENLRTSNGPDLRVYLSAGSSDASFGREYGEDFVELGKLKGNLGNQNYAVPAAVDLAKYRNAVVWCKRFSVGFGVATLE